MKELPQELCKVTVNLHTAYAFLFKILTVEPHRVFSSLNSAFAGYHCCWCHGSWDCSVSPMIRLLSLASHLVEEEKREKLKFIVVAFIIVQYCKLQSVEHDFMSLIKALGGKQSCCRFSTKLYVSVIVSEV